MILLLAAVLNIKAESWINSPPLRESDVAGRVVLIDFWAVWCLPCLGSVNTLQGYADELKEKPFTIVAVHFKAKRRQVLPYVHDYDIRYPVAIDTGTTWQHYGVTVLPTYYLLDKKGNLRYQGTEPPPFEMVEELLAE